MKGQLVVGFKLHGVFSQRVQFVVPGVYSLSKLVPFNGGGFALCFIGINKLEHRFFRVDLSPKLAKVEFEVGKARDTQL